MKARWRAVAVGTVIAIASLGPAVVGAQGLDPTVHVDRTGTAEGEKLLVTGDGWPAGATLIVELCGHGGLAGSVDCDVRHQRTAGVGASGAFSTELTVGTPPKPCPCVVKATDQSSHVAATAPIAVAGLPTVPITEADEDAARALEISSIDITGGGRIAELFGAGGRRVLSFTLVNTGAVAVAAPDVSIAWGSGGEPTGFVKPPDTASLDPGETQIITVGLDRPAMTLGEQTAVVEVTGVGEPLVARASSSAFPWGLVAIALAFLQGLLLVLRRWLRARLVHGSDGGERPDGIASLGPGAMAELPRAPEVIDLRGDEVIEIDEPVAPSPLASVAEPAMDEAMHREATAVMTATLIGEFTARADALRLRVEDERLKASVALTQASRLSEALVAAAEVRATEAAARADRRSAESSARLAEATDLLDAARAHAGELIDLAQRAAGEILATADLERDALARALAEVGHERDELVAAARAAVQRTTDDLSSRLEDLEEELLRHAQAMLRTATVERTSRPPADELDRRLARAVERAFSEV